MAEPTATERLKTLIETELPEAFAAFVAEQDARIGAADDKRDAERDLYEAATEAKK